MQIAGKYIEDEASRDNIDSQGVYLDEVSLSYVASSSAEQNAVGEENESESKDTDDIS